VGSAGIGCTEHAPLRIEPEVGQRPTNSIKPPSSDRWDVLQVDPSRSHLANDSEQLKEEAAALPVKTGSFACDADVLAWEPACDEVDAASPCVSVERGDVIVNLHFGGQPAFIAACRQHAPAVRVDLDGAHGAMPEHH
jgi:hypothetical protein